MSIGKSSRSISHEATICELTRRKISMGNCKCGFFLPSKYQPRLNKALVSLKYPGCYNSPLKKREGNWSQNASRNCFWDGCWGRADQLLASFFSLLLSTVPEAYARANSAQSFSRIVSGEFMRTYNFTMDLAPTSMVSLAHWLETEWTDDGKSWDSSRVT